MVIVYKESFWFLLVLIPVIILLIRARNTALLQMQILCGMQWIRKQGSLIRVRQIISSIATVLLFVCLVFAYADIYQGRTSIRRERSGAEIAFLVDVSNSMLADDIYPTRLQQAQVLVRSVMNYFPDLWYSLSVFKGDAITLIPMTQDRIALEQTMQILTPNLISTPGSNITEGIKVAAQSNASLSNRNQIVIVLSDGEQVNATSAAAVQTARTSGKKFILIAIGTDEGGVIRIDDTRYVTTSDGEPVITRVNRRLLESIAVATGGLFLDGSNEESFSRIVSYIESFQNSNVLVEQVNTPRYRLFIAGALLCILCIIGVGIIPWRK